MQIKIKMSQIKNISIIDYLILLDYYVIIFSLEIRGKTILFMVIKIKKLQLLFLKKLINTSNS